MQIIQIFSRAQFLLYFLLCYFIFIKEQLFTTQVLISIDVHVILMIYKKKFLFVSNIVSGGISSEVSEFAFNSDIFVLISVLPDTICRGDVQSKVFPTNHKSRLVSGAKHLADGEEVLNPDDGAGRSLRRRCCRDIFI